MKQGDKIPHLIANFLEKPESISDVWPGRYYVKAKCNISLYKLSDDFSVAGITETKKVFFLYFYQPFMSYEEAANLLSPLRYDLVDFKSQTENTFSEQQANELIAYLKDTADLTWKSLEWIDVWKEPACKPKEGCAGLSGLQYYYYFPSQLEAACRSEGIYMLSLLEKTCDLGFDVYFYYILEEDTADKEFLDRFELKDQVDILFLQTYYLEEELRKVLNEGRLFYSTPLRPESSAEENKKWIAKSKVLDFKRDILKAEMASKMKKGSEKSALLKKQSEESV